MKNKVTKALFKFFVFPLIAVLMLWLLPVSSVFGEGTSGSNIKELEEAVESAKKILEEAKEALDTANQVLIETQAKADEANKILSEAESSLQEAEARLADANVKVSEAKAALENASEGDDVESLQANLSSAEEELQAAQKAYDDAEAALEVAKANVEQAQQELEQAKLAVDEATGNLESAQKAYDDAVAALEEAQKNLAENDDNQNGDQNNSNSDDNDGNNDDGSNNEGGGENNGGSNSNENLTLLGVNSGTFGQEDPKINPSITTDKDDYHPEETVVISGSGFYPDTEYTIRVTRPDGAKDSSNVTSDGNGSFTYTYQLDGITGEYLVEAIDSEGSALASCKFTDTATCDDTRVDLHSDHQGADSSTFNEETGNNGGITKPGVVWHFILNGLSKDTPPATLYISFEGAKSSTVTASNGGKTQHFWVWTPTDDKLVSGQVYALVDSCAYNNLVLSHVCHNGGSTNGTIIVEKNVFAPNGSTDVSDDFVFNVSLYESNKESGNYNIVSTKTFSEGNPAVWSNLELNKWYKVVEESTDAYIEFYNTGKVKLTSSNSTGNILIKNKQVLGKIKVEKDVRRSDGHNVSDNHHFWVTLYMQTDSGGWEQVDKKEFWEGTPAVFDGLLKGRVYKAVEDDDPYYTLWSVTPETVTLACERTITIVNRQCPKGSITVTKTGLQGSDKAIFSLSGPGGPYPDIILDNGSGGYPSSGGWSNLPYGEYTITETWGSGNVYTYTTSLNPNPKNITVDGNETISVVNTKCTYSVTVNKSGLEWDYKSTWPFYWADSAIFTLTGPEGPNSQVRSITLDNCWFTSNPSSYTWDGLPAGSYTLEESYPDGNNFNYTSNISFPQSFDLGPSKTFNVVNSTEQITGSITVEKTGLEGNDKAIFSLSGPGGPYPDITLGNGESDGWSNLPYGSYTITESYPSGNVYTYTTNLSSDPIVINSDNENPTISVTNTSEKGSITVEKTDATDGSVLAGSTFALFKADGVTPATDAYGNTIPNQVTGVDGKAYFTNLAFGTYVVKEIGAPTGYGLADPVTVEVGGESGADVSIVISDPRIPGSVTINKINSSTGATMSGIGFTIYYKASGNPVYPEAFTNGSGLVTFSGLPWGTYTIVETTPPSGYTAASPVDVTITKDNALVGVSIKLSNTPVPPPPTPPTTTTTTTTTPTLAVAGVATPFLEVLGVSELPFTGLHPVIPIAAITLIIGGLVLIILAIKKREKEVKELR